MAIWQNGQKEGEIKRGVFAYLTAPDDTTVTTAGTYYPITGTFDNDPAENFSFIAGPAIQYDDTKVLDFEIDWHAGVSSEDGLRTISVGIKKNGVLEAASVMPIYLKTADEPGTLSGTDVVELSYGDTIQLVCTSSTNLDVLTFSSFTTTIRPFFSGGV